MIVGSVAPREPAIGQDLSALVLARLDAGAIELPLLPEVPARVMKLCVGDGDARELIEVLRCSAELTAHVFRWANSPLYRPRTPIVSLQQAVCRLGVRQIRDIALIVTCSTRVFRAPGYDAELRFVFRHSLATALFAQEIARVGRWNAEEAFLCGLLHHIGRPVLFQAVVDLRRDAKVAARRAEVFATVDRLHAEIGARVARLWQLPPLVVEAVAYHHDPTSAPEHARAAAVTLLAADLAHHALEPAAHPAGEVLAHCTLGALGIYPDELGWIMSRAAEIAAAAKAAP